MEPPNAHLIDLLATYECGGVFSLMFPWADGDLEAFWFRETPQIDETTVRWLAEQCRGLASGLAAIHQFCRHGDIKPQNILWFSRPAETQGSKGILKISDFGTAELNQNTVAKQKMAPASLMYQPPEACTSDTASDALGDVWSLGCIYLEFIAWFFGGWEEGVSRFLDKRLAPDNVFYRVSTGTFFLPTEDGETGVPRAEVKTSVYEVCTIFSSP